MKRIIMVGLLTAATLLGGLALTGGTANAIVVPDQPETEVCYAQVPYTVYQFSTTTSTPNTHVEYRWDIETRNEKFKDIIAKETQTRTWNAAVWQNFSPNNDQGPFEGPPSRPTDPRGTWNHQNKDIPGGHQGPDGVYQKGEGNGSWFYRAAGSWSAWGPWTDWPDAGPLIDDGRARGPLPHGSGDGWERRYRYVVVGQSPNGYTAWAPAGSTAWGLSDTPPARTTTTRYVNPQQRTVEDEPTVTVAYYNDGNVGPDNLAVKGVRANWTTDRNLDSRWKQLDDTDTFMKAGDRIPCEEQPEGYFTTRETSEPCTVVGQTKTTVTVSTQDWTYELNDDSRWVPVKDGVERVSTYVRDLTAEEQAGCPTPTPTPEQPGQAQLPPAPVAAAPAAVAPAAVAPAAPAPTQLPSTGSSSWALALVALAALTGGTALVRVSRRPTS